MSESTSVSSELHARLADDLARRLLPDGSYSARPGAPVSLEATGWSAVYWALIDDRPRRLAAARALAAAQSADGRLSASPLHPGASWPTPIAVLAWHRLAELERERGRAIDYLLALSGHRMERSAAGAVTIDPALVGWPWVERTFSWVGPTALALLALHAESRSGEARAAEGLRMLLDRQLPSGGWNYGNTIVFGSELLAAPEETGPALAALAGRVPRHTVASSLELLRVELGRIRTPLSLAWGVLALAAWGERPPAADAHLEESLALASRFGGYESTDLALLGIAALARHGLLAGLASGANA